MNVLIGFLVSTVLGWITTRFKNGCLVTLGVFILVMMLSLLFEGNADPMNDAEKDVADFGGGMVIIGFFVGLYFGLPQQTDDTKKLTKSKKSKKGKKLFLVNGLRYS